MLLACDEDCEFRAITSTKLSDATVDRTYNFQLTIDTSCEPEFREFRIVGGNLPPGINLGTAGLLQGTPTLQGNYLFTVEVELCYTERRDPDTNQPVFYNCKQRNASFSLQVFPGA